MAGNIAKRANGKWRARYRDHAGNERARHFDRKIDALFADPKRAGAARSALGQIERRIERYLWIKTLMSFATASLSWCVLAAVGCSNASFWALIIFMLNYIPILGPLFGTGIFSSPEC